MEQTRNATTTGISSFPVASEKYVRELDGIRAIAVLLVVLAHYGLGFIIPGAFGVTLFFFISGYLITTLFYAEFQSAKTINVSLFYARRWLRLTPPLVISIVLGVVFHRVTRTAVGGDAAPIGTILAALLYYTNYYDLVWAMEPARVIPFGIFWSLAVEEHFYLVWPWIMRHGVRQSRGLCLLIMALCACVLVWRIAARHGFSLSDDYTYMATDCRIDSILYGALLRVLFETPWASMAVELLRSRTCRILGVLALLATFAIRDENFRQTYRYTIQGLALMPLFTAVLVDNTMSFARRLLSSSPMVLIGRLSYSIYLLHLMARTPGEVYFGSPFSAGAVISGIVFTASAAYILFVFVDRPMGRLRHRFRPKKASVPDASTVNRVEAPIGTLRQ